MIRKRKKLGLAFIDEVAKVNFKSGHFRHKIDDDWKEIFLPNFNPGAPESLPKSFWRKTVFLSIVAVLFFIIFLRLFHLQIVEGKQNRELADGNRIQIRIIHAPRGVIFDRNGKILALNAPAFRLTDPTNKKTIVIQREQALEMEVKNDSRAALLEVDNVRVYPKGEEQAHILGYVSEATEDQLKSLNISVSQSYHPGDRVGQSGVESSFESILRGVDGGEIIEVDSTGKKLRTIRTIAPIAGKDVYLTIDADLQHQAYIVLSEGVKKAGSCCGALVSQDPANGQVLALVSYPSYDNNLFTNLSDDNKLAEILNDKNSPILNRVISGVYPPGSTFKILTSLAALGSGKITAGTTIDDTGQINLGTFKFTNWYFTQYGRTEGSVNLIKALQRSNDTYYYHIGQSLGEKVLIDWSRRINLGSRLGIDLPGEVPGLIGDNDWKVRNTGQIWYPGDTLHMAIGQGFLLLTPLQVSSLISYVAGDGHLYKPKLLLKVLQDNKIVSGFREESLLSDLTKKEDLKTIKQGLSLVSKDGGTAWPFFAFPIKTAGKTGTAEFGDLKNKTHAWYTSYAPEDDPKITATVLIEAGGEGSSVASPIVRELYRWYFSDDKNNLIKDLYQESSPSAKTLGE